MISKEIPELGLILLESCLESRQLKNIPFSNLLLGAPKLLGIYRDLFVNDLGNDDHIFLHMLYALVFACIKWMLFYSRVVFRHVSPSIAQWFASLQWIAFTLYICFFLLLEYIHSYFLWILKMMRMVIEHYGDDDGDLIKISSDWDSVHAFCDRRRWSDLRHHRQHPPWEI